jgi:uncharacterized membrane-anchored protein
VAGFFTPIKGPMDYDPEPTTVDLVFAAVFLLTVIACFILLWWGIGAEIMRWLLAKLGALYVR